MSRSTSIPEGGGRSFAAFAAASFVAASALVPLIVRLHVQHAMPRAYLPLANGIAATDLFTWYKSVAVIGSGAVALAATLAAAATRTLPRVAAPVLACLALAFWALFSAVLSPYQGLLLTGAPGLYEGLPVHLAYLALFVAASAFGALPAVRRALVISIGVSLAALAALALPEVFGIEPLLWPAVKTALLGAQAAAWHIARDGPPHAAASLGNPDYVGVYAAMTGTFFLTLALAARTRRAAAGYGILSAVALALLAASTSRSGFVAAAAATLVVCPLVARRRGQRAVARLAIAALVACATAFGSQRAGLLQVSQVTTWLEPPSARPTVKVAAVGSELHVALSGPEVILAPRGGTIAVLGPAGAYDVRRGELMTMPLVTLTRGSLSLPVALTPRGLRIHARNALLTPVTPQIARLPFKGDALAARTFIWERTLPLLARTWFLGRGPGAFALEFPNRDFGGLLAQFGEFSTIIDKPHNFYLQYAHAFGNVALLSLLLLFGAYAAGATRQLARRDPDLDDGLAAACFAAFLAFAVAGLANDSCVGVTPVFYVLWGLGWSQLHRRVEIVSSVSPKATGCSSP